MKKQASAAESNSVPTPILVRRKPGHPVGKSDDLTVDEVDKLLSLPDKRKKDEFRDYCVLLVLANSPMRKGELVSLTLGNLVNEGKHQFLTYVGLKKRSKKKYWLKIPISKQVFDILSRYMQSEYKAGKLDHNAPLFFTLGKHGPYAKRKLTPRAVDLIVKKYVRKAGIDKRITPHSFRATYLTQRADSYSLVTLQSLSGHSNVRELMPYIRTSDEKKITAALSRQYT